MRILTSRGGVQDLSKLLATTFLLALSLLGPLPAEAAILVAELNRDIIITENGRVASAPGPRLATIAGNALLSPAMPVTLASELPHRDPPEPNGVPKLRRVRVPAGTTFKVVTTAYSSTVAETDGSPFITASGTHVHDGTLAANFLPIGTKVKFPSYTGEKIYIVEDRANPKYSSRADIWFPSRSAALRFGKRTLKMVVVD